MRPACGAGRTLTVAAAGGGRVAPAAAWKRRRRLGVEGACVSGGTPTPGRTAAGVTRRGSGPAGPVG
ncbi:hypothetical protein [Pilimelia anulata]|uniref:hypothetical protein n=1 Tax=Pilimelia anulata TaxID=53371 RepID=UPI0016686C07|nr:hypothetical protein [Pilimelia anulata]